MAVLYVELQGVNNLTRASRITRNTEQTLLLPPGRHANLQKVQLTCAKAAFRNYQRRRQLFLSAKTESDRDTLWAQMHEKIALYNRDAGALPTPVLDQAKLPHHLG